MNPASEVLTTILVVEAFCVVALLAVSRKARLSFWSGAVLLALHYLVWLLAAWTTAREHTVLSPVLVLFLTAFPASSVVWLIHLGDTSADLHQRQFDTRGVAISLLGFVLVALPFLPAKAGVYPKGTTGVSIEMIRSGCYGKCPVYSIAISDTGIVKYKGENNLGSIGNKGASVSQEQVSQLLAEFDRVHFFSLDDRAFEHCSDTPTVTVSIANGRERKTVTSNTYCTGARPGPQFDFVTAAEKIDEIVGSNRWVRCTSHCSN